MCSLFRGGSGHWLAGNNGSGKGQPQTKKKKRGEKIGGKKKESAARPPWWVSCSGGGTGLRPSRIVGMIWHGRNTLALQGIVGVGDHEQPGLSEVLGWWFNAKKNILRADFGKFREGGGWGRVQVAVGGFVGTDPNRRGLLGLSRQAFGASGTNTRAAARRGGKNKFGGGKAGWSNRDDRAIPKHSGNLAEKKKGASWSKGPVCARGRQKSRGG